MILSTSFTLNIEPFSINQMFTLTSYKTSSYKKWQEFFIHEMLKQGPQKAMSQVREFFSPDSHAVMITLVYMFPKNILFTSKGTLSSRAFDLSNIEKNVIDLLCLPKVHEASDDWGAPNMNFDDKNIVKLLSKKEVSIDGNTCIHVTVDIVPIESVRGS